MFGDLRAHYMSGFEQSLAEARPEFAKVAAEVMLDVPLPGEPELLYRIMRMDIMGQDANGPRAIEVNVNELMPAGNRLDGFRIPITLHAAVWNGLEFVIDGPPPDEARLLPWIAKWVDIDDRRYVEGADFQSVIHNCMRPAMTASGCWISVDFGSAPEESVFELIGILLPGANSMQIGSGLRPTGRPT